MPQIIINIIQLAIVQGILLSLLLYFKKENRHANRVLSIAILFLSLDILCTYLTQTKTYEKYPSLFGFNVGYPFIYGPIFYIYTLLVTRKVEKFKPKLLLHFIPFVVVYLYVSPFYLLTHDEKLLKINEYMTQVQWDMEIISVFKPIHGILYTWLSLRIISEFSERLKISFSNIDKKKLDWLKFLILSTIVVWVVVAIVILTGFILGSHDIFYDVIIYSFISVLVYAIGYGALNHAEVLNQSELVILDAPEDQTREKYEKSNLTDDDIIKFKERLLDVLQTKKLYLKSDLTLTNLSEELGISNHNLSEVINKAFNKNFYDLINAYRVEEVKEIIKNPDFAHYSLLAIAFEAGFSSKSSFNTIFKKLTNTTPSEFRKQFA
ncbi:MAG: helix-turn-helix domain-containing protein [Ignavibacteria bacterium]|nr:helix-turn-helix domain-containing protein [Ignavibacteria bacterium]